MNQPDFRQAVDTLYRTILRREPDPAGDETVRALEKGEIDLAGVIQGFATSPEFQAAVGVSQGNGRFTNDYSQFGEVEAILRRMVNRQTSHVVVDVGARGKDRSNSFDLMSTFGWRGLLIEANPQLAAGIETSFAGLNFSLLSCAVSDYEGEATFHIGVNDDVSSLTYDAAAGWGAVKGSIKVPVRRLPAILNEAGIERNFDLLSIDIEGEDIKVLNDTVAGGYLPRWVVIEASHNFTVKTLFDAPFSDTVRSQYVIVDQTPANLILELATL